MYPVGILAALCDTLDAVSQKALRTIENDRRDEFIGRLRKDLQSGMAFAHSMTKGTKPVDEGEWKAAGQLEFRHPFCIRALFIL